MLLGWMNKAMNREWEAFCVHKINNSFADWLESLFFARSLVEVQMVFWFWYWNNEKNVCVFNLLIFSKQLFPFFHYSLTTYFFSDIHLMLFSYMHIFAHLQYVWCEEYKTWHTKEKWKTCLAIHSYVLLTNKFFFISLTKHEKIRNSSKLLQCGEQTPSFSFWMQEIHKW